MYRLIADGKEKFKSSSLPRLYKFINDSPESNYQFFIGYNPITTDEFLKTYLQRTNNYSEYFNLYLILKPKTTIKKWLTTR